MTVPPRPSSRCLIARPRRVIGRILLVAALLLPACVSPADSSQAAPKDIAKKTVAPRPLTPQTRYTVRKQIESIRPTEWLANYGQVEVREVRR